MSSLVSEICRYFRDFLETDFKRRRLPKRRIAIRDSNGRLLGINLTNYPTFREKTWELLIKTVDDADTLIIPKGRYRSRVPAVLRDLVRQSIDAIQTESISMLGNSLKAFIQSEVENFDEDITALHAKVMAEAERLAFEVLVEPLTAKLARAIGERGQSEESVFDLEDQLAEILVYAADEPLGTAVNRWVAHGDSSEVDLVIESFLGDETIREKLREAFDNFAAGDLFVEFSELSATQKQTDNLEFYLNIGDLRFENHVFPLFQFRLSVTAKPASFDCSLDPHIYVNKRALEYVSEEIGRQEGRQNRIVVEDRIIYLEGGETPSQIMNPLTAQWGTSLFLPRQVDFNLPSRQNSGGSNAQISNATWLSVYDKSEDSLINDYEELLENDESEDGPFSRLQALFSSFLKENPNSVRANVDSSWESKSISDRLVFETPVPLNEEQRKILWAAGRSDCKVISVQGPPGTGKSHTITGLVFDAILKGRSILILSDKKEALDVVEDKITQCLSKIRPDNLPQDPILRLGKTDSTYAKILQRSTLEQIRAFNTAQDRRKEELEQNIRSQTSRLKKSIEGTVIALSKVKLGEVARLNYLERQILDIDEELLDELEQESSTAPALAAKDLAELIEKSTVLIRCAAEYFDPLGLNDLLTFLRLCKILRENILSEFAQSLQCLGVFTDLDDEGLETLQKYLQNYENIKIPLLGFVFKKKPVQQINQNLAQDLDVSNPLDIHKRLKYLHKVNNVMTAVRVRLNDEFGHADLMSEAFGMLASANKIWVSVSDNDTSEEFERFYQGLGRSIKFLEFIGLSLDDLSNWNDADSIHDLATVFEYLKVHATLRSAFAEVPKVDFTTEKSSLEELHTHRLARELDSRVLTFADEKAATASTLKEIIKKKRKFPKDQFDDLLDAFPCVISSIREYAEYIPLNAKFDLVVIDEGSQVSIAQALPAMLRSETLVVFGDPKQFSNVKSTNASREINNRYLNSLKDAAGFDINDASFLTRLEKVNIQTSVLEFTEMVANYSCMLRKHFRGYAELISFSNRYFYSGHLQAIKLRGKPLKDVIEFVNLSTEELELGLVKNANRAEAEYIKSQLDLLLECHSSPTVGVITPFTNQQKYLIRYLREEGALRDYEKELRLKVMTFDSCQGEERELVFYSMVASKDHDRTAYIFPRDLERADEVENVLRLQRLNVGFSRVQEKMIFVLSQPVEDFGGSLGIALRHYQDQLAKAELPTIEETESPMERKVLEWIQATPFWQKHDSEVELRAQFKMGEYLKQLDPTYKHPKYRVDFLVTGSIDGRPLNIVIEYDGFREHFQNWSEVDDTNWPEYLRESDIEREKIIESYGFMLLRINRFNLGRDPVETLSCRLSELVGDKEFVSKGFTDGVRNEVEDVISGAKKECVKCHELKPKDAFRDPSLKSGIGRICTLCKESSRQSGRSRRRRRLTATIFGQSTCPICGSVMILRTAKRGRHRGNKFLGCSTFPRCRGTRSYTA